MSERYVGRFKQSQAEVLHSFRESLMLLTGGCEVCHHSVGSYCEMNKRPVKPGDPRCGYFAQRYEDSEEASKAQVQRYVNDILGISGRNSKRLVG